MTELKNIKITSEAHKVLCRHKKTLRTPKTVFASSAIIEKDQRETTKNKK